MKRFLVLSLLALVPCGALQRSAAAASATFYVDNLTHCAGLAPCFDTIQGAIDAAGPDTSIEVFDGVYHEAVRIFRKDRLALNRHGGMPGPVIAPPATARDAIQIIQSPGARIDGFIVEAPEGTGVAVAGGASAAATIENNFIRGGGVFFNSVYDCAASRNTLAGGGLNGGGSQGCVIEGNVVEGTISFDEGLSCGPRRNSVRGNVVRGGSIAFSGRCTEDNVLESNRVDGGGISLQGSIGTGNLIRANLVLGGVLDLHGNVAFNTLEDNFVSRSPTDGIRIGKNVGMHPNTIQRNTAVDNAVCDIHDVLPPFTPANLWLENRYVTSCGDAAAATVRP